MIMKLETLVKQTVKNNNVINLKPEVQKVLDDSALNVAEGNARAYGAEKCHAELLNNAFAFDWFTMTKGNKSESGQLVEVQRLHLTEALKAKAHSNPATVWNRVKKYAEQAKYPERFLKGEVDEDGVEQVAQGEKGAENAERSPAVRYVEELTRLWKFGARQEDLDKKSLDTHKAIQKILSDTWQINLAELEK